MEAVKRGTRQRTHQSFLDFATAAETLDDISTTISQQRHRSHVRRESASLLPAGVARKVNLVMASKSLSRFLSGKPFADLRTIRITPKPLPIHFNERRAILQILEQHGRLESFRQDIVRLSHPSKSGRGMC